MGRFLIEVPHPPDSLGCAKAIQVFLQSGSHYLTNAEWGCADNEHCGWMLVEADDKAEATGIVPPAYRPDARVVELRRFSMEFIEETIRQHSD